MPDRINHLLSPLPARQEAQDERSWASAVQETGHLLQVLWGEIMQLLGDFYHQRPGR